MAGVAVADGAGTAVEKARPVLGARHGLRCRAFVIGYGWGGSGFPEDSVALFPCGVGVGVIEGVVEAAAFRALEGGLDDDFGDGGEVAELEEV